MSNIPTRVGAVEITPGVIDLDSHFAFNNGQCHAFALALQAVIGGDLVWGGSDQCASYEYVDDPCAYGDVELPESLDPMSDADCPCQIDHVMVKIGDEFFDINGCWKDIDARFISWGYLSNEEAEALGSLSTWSIPDIDMASTFVEPYLNRIDRLDIQRQTL